MQRRDVLKCGLAAAAGLMTRPSVAADDSQAAPIDKRLCLFTDHLDDFGYSYAEVAGMLSKLPLVGPDLTVRPGGLVPPDRAADELPKAAEAFRDVGLSVPMVSSELTSAGSPNAKPLVATLGKLGIRYFKLGYYHYHDLSHWETELDAQRKQLAGLLALCQDAGVEAGFHNHSGAGIGGAIWDAWQMLQSLDPKLVGFYFDAAHASIEGAKHTWKLNLTRIAPRLKMVALKDYVWEKTSNGPQTRWVPLGEGMVNWPEFFRELVKIPFAGPVSIHIEYDPGGKTKSERIDNALNAAKRDLEFVRRHLFAVQQ